MDDVKSPGEAVENFLRKLSGSKEKIGSISCSPDVRADIFVGELGESNLQFPNIVLSTTMLQTLAEMALQFDCTFYGWKHVQKEHK